jgi:two-component system catabolic regulation response regulator CreB
VTAAPAARTRVLVVEDEPAIADTICYALSTDGFEPEWCSTGAAALQALAATAPGLIILDVGLPDINGFELFKQLGGRTRAPVIFLTARAEEVDRIVGLELGADDYIAKPFSPRELTARVRAVLRRLAKAEQAQPPPPADSRGSAFGVDDERRVITYRGRPLDLSRYEYRVLKLLVSRPGRVFSRDDILQQAWDEPDASYDRTVDAHIKTIRAKLKAVAADVDPIRTHRGEGYSLREV